MDVRQLERIRKMEQRLDLIEKAVRDLSVALDRYLEVQAEVEQLDEYYGSDTWRGDYDDDKANKLPDNLKRGILSEDAIWNVLSDVRELNNRLSITAKVLTKG